MEEHEIEGGATSSTTPGPQLQRQRSDATDGTESHADVGDLISPASIKGLGLQSCDLETESPSNVCGIDGECSRTQAPQDAPLNGDCLASEATAADGSTASVCSEAAIVASEREAINAKRKPFGKAAPIPKKQKREGSGGMLPTETATPQGRRLPLPSPLPFDSVGCLPSETEAADSRSATDATQDDALRKEVEYLKEQYYQQRRKTQSAMKAQSDAKQVLRDTLVQLAKRQETEELDTSQAATYRLGHCRQTMAGIGQTTWSGGYEEEDISKTRDRWNEDRNKLDKERKAISKEAKGPSADEDDIWERREILTHRSEYLKREDQTIKDREARLQVDRQLNWKHQQRLEAALRSNFRGFPPLPQTTNRYQLLNMLGRGGFSEVYRAFDLESSSYCAVKIHELGKDMSEVHRQNYIRRAMREYEIQKGLKHPKVVTLLDCFPVNNRVFSTVLELCEGDTLDEYMKRHGVLTEREARGIIIQVLSGLRYLNQNETGNKIIHYDLKPGNLFFHYGEVKIADFGLSKIVHQSNVGESIELTSQGAGTYWYLPPECMLVENNSETPKISNKVDVWSTGVIFFELLYGKKPYGHGLSQEAFRRAAMAGQALYGVQLPPTPKVSSECARFLKRLLELDKDNRPDVIEAFNDPYLKTYLNGAKRVRVGSPNRGAGSIVGSTNGDVANVPGIGNAVAPTNGDVVTPPGVGNSVAPTNCDFAIPTLINGNALVPNGDGGTSSLATGSAVEGNELPVGSIVEEEGS